MKITKKTTFAEIIEKYPKLTHKLAEKGMFCISCPMAQQETIEQGAKAHGIKPDKLVKELNKEIEK
jgi:hybrid cluster-associated redox disulfide protein